MQSGFESLGVICLTLAASVFAFLFFNWSPSRIFMGDTGSMVLGFGMGVMMILFVNLNVALPAEVGFQSPVAMSFALLVIPVYDTIRVFIIRWSLGRSPMSPDRNHTHHILIKLGLSHGQSAGVLVGFNIFMVSLTWLLQPLGNNWLCLIILLLAVGFGVFIDFRLRRKILSIRKQSIPASLG